MTKKMGGGNFFPETEGDQVVEDEKKNVNFQGGPLWPIVSLWSYGAPKKNGLMGTKTHDNMSVGEPCQPRRLPGTPSRCKK